MGPINTGFVDQHVTFKQAAATLGCSVWTVQRTVAEYNVPCLRIGATRLASWEHLLAARRMAKSKALARVG